MKYRVDRACTERMYGWRTGTFTMYIDADSEEEAKEKSLDEILGEKEFAFDFE